MPSWPSSPLLLSGWRSDAGAGPTQAGVATAASPAACPAPFQEVGVRARARGQDQAWMSVVLHPFSLLPARLHG